MPSRCSALRRSRRRSRQQSAGADRRAARERAAACACSGARPAAPARRCARRWPSASPATSLVGDARAAGSRALQSRAGVEHAGLQQHLARSRVADGARHQLRLARRHRKAEPGDRRAEAGRRCRRCGCRSSSRSPGPRPCRRPRSARPAARRSPAWPAAPPQTSSSWKSRSAALVEAERRVLGDVAAGAEGAALAAARPRSAARARACERFEDRAQLAPHRARSWH